MFAVAVGYLAAVAYPSAKLLPKRRDVPAVVGAALTGLRRAYQERCSTRHSYSTGGPVTPTQVYHARIESGELSPDKHQEKVVEHFQDLHHHLNAFSPLNSYLHAAGTTNSGQSILTKARQWLLGSTPSAQPTAGGIPRGIYLWGTVGGGKTMLMDLFFDTVQAVDDRKSRVHYNDFMQEVHQLLHEAKKAAPPRDHRRWDTYQPFDPIPPVGSTILARSYLICLDEFQVTDIADAMILRHLFSYLFDHGLVLVATSNRPPDDLYKKGLQRSNFLPFIDLLKERCNIVSLDPGIDYRRRAMGGSEKLYFLTTDPDEDADAALNVIFKFLSSKETDKVRPRTIRIKGRDVSFGRTCGGLLDSDFEELCGRPLWTNDYIKIAQVFHTVFIRNIPIITRKKRSEARRFITLIDTLYDHRVRVVASGEVPYFEIFQAEEVSEQDRLEENRMLVDDLGIQASEKGSMDVSVFSGEEELFAFDRTVSRLTEMQTKDYWKKWRTHVANTHISTTEEALTAP